MPLCRASVTVTRTLAARCTTGIPSHEKKKKKTKKREREKQGV